MTKCYPICKHTEYLWRILEGFSKEKIIGFKMYIFGIINAFKPNKNFSPFKEYSPEISNIKPGFLVSCNASVVGWFLFRIENA